MASSSVWNYCTGPARLPEETWGAHVLSILYFLLTEPCAQRIATFLVNSIFVIIIGIFAGYKLWSVRLHKKSRGVSNGNTPATVLKVTRVGKSFTLTVVLTGVSCFVYLLAAAWRFWVVFVSNWEDTTILELTFACIQFMSWLIFATVVAHEKLFCARHHPPSLRAWWVALFILSIWPLASALVQFARDSPYDPASLDDILALVIFPVTSFLMVISIKGRTGLVVEEVVPDLIEPLLDPDAIDQNPALVTDYAEASLFNRAGWFWMNPLLKTGAEKALQLGDIPYVAPEDRAEKMYDRFIANWPKEATQHPVRLTLLKSFWPQLLFVGSLAFTRLCVMYIGPLLIQRFVDFASGAGSSPYEGYYLTAVLLVATVVQVMSAHHYNFQANKLGMQVRASLITALYQKGLRLSSSARQEHGLGQIVQYMSVDVQQLGDVVIQLHNMWMLPMQIIVALTILFSVVGIATIAGLTTMVLLVVVTMATSGYQRFYLASIARMRDSRMKALTEVLNNMKIIKLQSWEEHFRKRVESFRESEYGWAVKYWVSLSYNIALLWMSPSVVSVVTFGLCVILGIELTPGRVFTATATFRILMEPVRLFPQALIAISQAMVSLDRLDKFMVSKELDTTIVERLPPGEEIAVSVEGGSFTWDDDSLKPALMDINVKAARGSLVTIVGMVGSGKSSLLSSILGEMPKLSGSVKISGSSAYVAQTSWIQGGTIEENILFGLPMDRSWYEETIRVCSLETDLRLMDNGDQTEIGDRGVNLSGGQKQRIQLARAVYQNCDVYLLDDIFSAVDAHTSSALFKQCIRGVLRSKTVLLVTHQVEFLHGADQILVMRDGKIVQSGKYDDLLREGADFEALVNAHDEALQKVSSSQNEEASDGITSEGSSHSPLKYIQKQSSMPKGVSEIQKVKSETKKDVVKLVEEEQRGVGRVAWVYYKMYGTKASGWSPVIGLLLLQTMWQGMLVCGDYWLALETSDNHRSQFRGGIFMAVYASFAFGSWIAVCGRTALGTSLGLKTAQLFFLTMLRSIFRAPMAFFDTTPTGRIISRSIQDQSTMDITLAFQFGAFLGVLFSTFGILFVMIQVTPPIFFIIAALSYTFFVYQAYFIPSSRELTRMDAITKAPIIDHFSGTVAGCTTIRCFEKQDQFSTLNVERVNSNIRMDFHNNAANEWLGLRLEMIGSIILCFSALLLVTLPRSMVNPDLVGLSLSYGFALNLSLYWLVLTVCQIENKMVAVERISQYSDLPSEAPLVIEGSQPPPSWPQEGTIMLQDLKLRYRPNTPLVLKGLSLTIRGGERVGVVGRTGSGKSTLLQALFRLVEPASGRIIVDGIDIGTLGLSDLRSKLAIIPQEPTLFEGTVRTNIDPLGVYSDKEIWDTLEKCQLRTIVEDKPGKLDFKVVDDGDNWSVGQKQLFCLGRAILKRSRILFLDEATASVDSQTDAMIQKAVRVEFASSTVISIAHRILSVLDSDKVLVLDAGLVQEYDSPTKLKSRQGGLFASLLREYSARAQIDE
ncbi:protein MpABCC11 [Marchantia polymorpha subsp. ruderalis]|uniref:Uncharacterized protein n=2 Tax=Marchantia polymorpha TaxID=3197 RepID=A0A176VRU1_MARPO|nr:hypothetical protein AXG93_961s1000 [Marchantia polymorpha subsp. ruderalis]PTQ41804.1 hypothetical protein MARPO_0032s0013 [Marchantia polymorpha]BBN11589.1 hypothetical protein Mp_5g13190 [Marchantia polymorpha subsp. ruderalis]|eukprot:PTQ41804.1 hypothetical protein MARPO_0032s0013 [Marchantia polymorpha]